MKKEAPKKKADVPVAIGESSGNVFADLGEIIIRPARRGREADTRVVTQLAPNGPRVASKSAR
jgi:hypothetical protein